ncbi:hypothetical protein C1701_11565 [Actinoalloteichus sp. AHMU CJ021]|nr:hypothetical protein C1701_11565 [Actinoalloteichus sp. AHMU CJ021]
MGERWCGRVAVVAAALLLTATQARPHRIRRVLGVLRRSTREADLSHAQRAFEIVTTVSPRCAGGHHCLHRSLAVLLACRLRGLRVTWRVGFRSPPPQAHAWVEVNGEPLCEPVDPRRIYTPSITV